NAALPLDSRHSERRTTSYLLDYEVKSGRWSILEPLVNVAEGRRVRQVGWKKEGEELLVTHQALDDDPEKRVKATRLEGTLYTLAEGRWVGHSVPSTEQVRSPLSAKESKALDGFKIILRESANDPPMVVASDERREVALLEPDPALQGIQRAQVEVVEW